MRIEIDHLFNHPRHIARVAGAIYDEFWADQNGYSAADLERLLGDANSDSSIPLSFVALALGEPVGTINLIDNDDEARTHLHPWLAALVVLEPHRGQGIGTALVERLLDAAARLGYSELYLGTDAPAFYARFGATIHEHARSDLVIMRCPTQGRSYGAQQ